MTESGGVDGEAGRGGRLVGATSGRPIDWRANPAPTPKMNVARVILGVNELWTD